MAENEQNERNERDEVVAYMEREPSTAEMWCVSGLILGAIGVVGTAIWAAVKDEERMKKEVALTRERIERKIQEKQDWFNEENEAGNIVYELKDGRYLVVPRVGEQRVVIK